MSGSKSNESPKVILPIIKIDPSVIAGDIISVQPMFSPFSRDVWPYQVELYDIIFSKSSAVNIKTITLEKFSEWCRANLEPKSWTRKSQYLAFKNEKDFMWFQVTWM